MSNLDNVKEVKGKKLNWTQVNNKFNIRVEWPLGTGLYGYYTWPYGGSSTGQGELVIHERVGQEIIDSTNVQGARIVKDLEIKVVGESAIIEHSYYIAVCKYNKSYGGTPFPCRTPTVSAVNEVKQYWNAEPVVRYYQSCIGSGVFHGDKCDQIVIKCQDAVLDSDDSIMICFGNIDMLGDISENTTTHYLEAHDYQVQNGDYVSIAGVVTGAVAYL